MSAFFGSNGSRIWFSQNHEPHRCRTRKAKRPRPDSTPTKPERIRRSARREVFARDGEQCTFVSATTKVAERSIGEGDATVDVVLGRARGAAGPPPVEQVVRDALRVLT